MSRMGPDNGGSPSVWESDWRGGFLHVAFLTGIVAADKSCRTQCIRLMELLAPSTKLQARELRQVYTIRSGE